MLGWGGLALAFSPGMRADGRGRLDGSFIQLLEYHGRWGDEEWQRLFEAFAELGLNELVVQWAVHDRTALFGSEGNASAPRPLEQVLAHAQRAGMRVLLGLVYDPRYWSEEARAPDRVGALFDTLLARSTATARALLPLVARHPAVTGWHICEEVDDRSWDAARRPHLFAYLAQLADTLRSLAPGSRVAVSGFTDARSQPPDIETFWRELLAAAPGIDRVLFQDGIGADKLELTDLGERLGAVARAVRAQGRELSVVIQTFRDAREAHRSEPPFSASPAPLARILAQMEAAFAHTPSLIAFSVPEHMSPQGAAAARALYRDYLAHLSGAPPAR